MLVNFLKKFKNHTLGRLFLPVILVHACGDTKQWLHPHDRSNSDAPQTVTPSENLDDPAFQAALTNTDYLTTSVNLKAWIEQGFHGRSHTIAILDNGFAGLEVARGKTLPPDISIFQGPINNQAQTLHGTKLAEVIFAMTSGSPDWRLGSKHPKIKLYNANGFSNFTASVDQAILDGVDIILYSQVWEFGGNFDGRGFINSAVNKATSKGILWINAAGNYATSSWQGALQLNDNSTARLPFEEQFVRLVINENGGPVKITLSWNDFADSKEWRTSRDLDLVLLDKNGREITASRKIQDGIDHGRDPAYSAHARETLETNLRAGIYLLRVDARSKNFDGNSRIRLAANGPGVSFIDQSVDASVMIPADNPNVLTIGASDDPSSSYGQTISGVSKPEVLAPSTIEFESGISFKGSSSAAAVAAATLAVYREACGLISRDKIIQLISDGSISQQSTKGVGLWLPNPRFCR